MASVEYFIHKGIPFSKLLCTEEILSYVENEFQILDDDVVNVTFPKSGTNWMQEILGLIQKDGDPSWVQNVDVEQRSPWIELKHGLKCALEYPPPRLLASHLPSQLFPKSFFQSKAKVIYTLRNPKDVLISFYHFSRILKAIKTYESLEECMEDFLRGNVLYGSWFDHVKGWMEWKNRENFFFITYEELQQDLKGCVEKICRFLGKDLTGEQVDSVVENASFEKMKDNKMSNFSLMSDTYFDHKKGKLLRKGISGDWKNHLTEAESEHFDCVYKEKMQGVNMTFPWD